MQRRALLSFLWVLGLVHYGFSASQQDSNSLPIDNLEGNDLGGANVIDILPGSDAIKAFMTSTLEEMTNGTGSSIQTMTETMMHLQTENQILTETTVHLQHQTQMLTDRINTMEEHFKMVQYTAWALVSFWVPRVSSLTETMMHLQIENKNLTETTVHLQHQTQMLTDRIDTMEEHFRMEKDRLEERIARLENNFIKLQTFTTEPPSTTTFTNEQPSTTEQQSTSTVNTHGSIMPATTFMMLTEDYKLTIYPNDISSFGASLTTSVLALDNDSVLINNREGEGNVQLYRRSLGHKDREIVTLYGKPWTIAPLLDGRFAVTMEDGGEIYILKIERDNFAIDEAIHVSENYGGICALDNKTLVVSKGTDESLARIVIIDMDGRYQRSLLENFSDLVSPFCLQVYNGDVYVSDWTTNMFFKVALSGENNVTWQMGELDLRDLRLQNPRNFVIDGDGTVYLATGGEQCKHERIYTSYCVLRITQEGELTSFITYDSLPYYKPERELYPYGVDVKDTRLYVTWAGLNNEEWESKVNVYPFDQLEFLV